ncbi:MAG: spore coat U domain-containing protein [Methylotetracoccus sp.]
MLLVTGNNFAMAASCSVNTIPVAFFAYDTLSPTPNISGMGTIQVTCEHTAPQGAEVVSYTVSLSRGLSGTYLPRQMVKGSERLEYNLYQDASRVVIWGDGTSGSLPVTSVLPTLSDSNPIAQDTLNVYGRIPERQNVRAGMYSDTITVTVEWQ